MPEDLKKYVVRMSQAAERDLSEITRFIAKNNPQNATKIKKRIQAKISTLDHFPNRGAYVSELLANSNKDFRQITESPWKIIYKVDDNIVRILAIVDSRRNLKDILMEKLSK